MLNGLDLFSGIGGLTLALSDYVLPLIYCERDPYCQALLVSRMQDGSLPSAPVWSDVTSLRGAQFSGHCDIVYGGFPCQDISAAGAGIGLGGERSGLFQHIARLVGETNPRFVFLENVPAIRTRGLNCVAQTFTELGYDCRWTIVSAAEVGAPHLRKRWFMLAHDKSSRTGLGCKETQSKGWRAAENWGESLRQGNRNTPDMGADSGGAGSYVVAHADCGRLVERDEKVGGLSIADETSDGIRSDQWSTEPNVGRVVNGLPFRVDRLRGLGNAVVPRQAQVAFERLMGLTKERK